MDNHRVKVVIPARYGSSRLPAKPLLELNGMPIFWHVVQRVIEAGVMLEDIIIATDHEAILTKAHELKLPILMTSLDQISGTDRINEIATILDWPESTIVINVQGDEPLIPANLILDLIKFTAKNQYDISTVVTPIVEYDELSNPNVVKAIVTEFGQALYFTRTACPYNRDFPLDMTLAHRHIGIYAYTVRSLAKFCSLPESALENYEKLEQLRALTHNLTIGALVYVGKIPHGIDTKADYLAIKEIMEY
jgi:3-deoxy-manno-octulosonate cytidylyltransferase (CMP-KDO synthetase)